LETEKNILEDLFSSVLLQFKKHHRFGNIKSYNLVIVLKIVYFDGKNPISLKLQSKFEIVIFSIIDLVFFV